MACLPRQFVRSTIGEACGSIRSICCVGFSFDSVNHCFLQEELLVVALDEYASLWSHQERLSTSVVAIHTFAFITERLHAMKYVSFVFVSGLSSQLL